MVKEMMFRLHTTPVIAERKESLTRQQFQKKVSLRKFRQGQERLREVKKFVRPIIQLGKQTVNWARPISTH